MMLSFILRINGKIKIMRRKLYEKKLCGKELLRDVEHSVILYKL